MHPAHYTSHHTHTSYLAYLALFQFLQQSIIILQINQLLPLVELPTFGSRQVLFLCHLLLALLVGCGFGGCVVLVLFVSVGGSTGKLLLALSLSVLVLVL